jgi:Leucine-rich repeat (LRR) protein
MTSNYNIQNCSIDNLKFILFSISSNTSSSKQITIQNNTDCPNIPDLLNDISNFYSLSVINSNFTTLTDSIGEIKDITSINLMNLPYLASLPVSIGSLSTLTSLNITNLAVESIPPLNKNLTTLSIQDNSNLKTLPEFNNLPNLKYLRISNNNISVLPDSIRSLQELEYLYIDEKLESIPEWIGELKSLNSLSIMNTNINSLPSSIGKLENLMNLEIKMNQNLHDLPESFGDLLNIKNIDLIFINNSFVLPRSFETLLKNNNIQLSIQSISS